MMERKAIEGVVIKVATSTDQIKSNISAARALKLPEIHNHADWRQDMPIAIVGGGPSLTEKLADLRRFKSIMAAGSAHDFLIEKGIVPRWTVICDGDAVMANYLRRPQDRCIYLVASQCDPAVFKALNGRHVVLWHAGDDVGDPEIFGEQCVLLGGGCTVGTRAIIIARLLGFNNIHLFGMDTCLRKTDCAGKLEFEHHAYPFSTVMESEVCVGNIQPVQIGDNGRVYHLANYHLGQLFDFRTLLGQYPDMKFTVHGDSALAELARESNRRLAA